MKSGEGMNLVIYGAQGIALGTYEAVSEFSDRNIICFLVTERCNNPASLMGVPVYELESFAKGLSDEDKGNIEVIIATPENVMPEIEAGLEDYGLMNHVRMTSGRFAELVGYFHVFKKDYIPLSAMPAGTVKADVHAFMAKFYKDKVLSTQFDMPEWIETIQVGAALCVERVSVTVDCDGDNISGKNVNYSELTALYWIWKNKLNFNNGNEYYGLVHYRRILDLSEDDLYRLKGNDIDVVLPYPMPYEPDIGEHHKRYLAATDWNALIAAMKEIHPEYIEKMQEVLSGRYMYNYNIMIAKKNVLREYCEWLFPILERVEELSEPKGWERKDRYIGYIGETMATVYFMSNRDRLNIAHAGCRFLV